VTEYSQNIHRVATPSSKCLQDVVTTLGTRDRLASTKKISSSCILFLNFLFARRFVIWDRLSYTGSTLSLSLLHRCRIIYRSYFIEIRCEFRFQKSSTLQIVRFLEQIFFIRKWLRFSVINLCHPEDPSQIFACLTWYCVSSVIKESHQSKSVSLFSF